MITDVTCVVCPVGCRMKVTKVNGEYKVEGNTCKRGSKYAVEEVTNPRRVLTTTVKIDNSYLNLLPVKTKDSIPKPMMFEIMEFLDKIKVSTPIKVGDIIVENILETGVDIVSAKTLDAM